MRMAASKLWLPHSAAARPLWQLMHRTRILNTQEPDNKQNRVKLLHHIATLHLQVNVPTHENAQLVPLK